MAEPVGTVEAIYLAGAHGELPHAVPFAVAHAGRGLEGDRQFDDPGAGDVTLIEAEVLEKLSAEHGVDLRPGESRRQVVVREADLGAFIGRRFMVGEVECEGEERCEPCQHLVSLVSTPAVLRGLLHSGLRAAIVRGGTIRSGDTVRLSVIEAARVE